MDDMSSLEEENLAEELPQIAQKGIYPGIPRTYTKRVRGGSLLPQRSAIKTSSRQEGGQLIQKLIDLCLDLLQQFTHLTSSYAKLLARFSLSAPVQRNPPAQIVEDLLMQMEKQNAETVAKMTAAIDPAEPVHEKSVTTTKMSSSASLPSQIARQVETLGEEVAELKQKLRALFLRLGGAGQRLAEAAECAAKLWPQLPGARPSAAAFFDALEGFAAELGLPPRSGAEEAVEAFLRLEAFALHRFEDFAFAGAAPAREELRAVSRFCVDLSFAASQLSSLCAAADHPALQAPSLREAVGAFAAAGEGEEQRLFRRLSVFAAVRRQLKAVLKLNGRL